MPATDAAARQVGHDHDPVRGDAVGPHPADERAEQPRHHGAGEDDTELGRSPAAQDDRHRQGNRVEGVADPREALAGEQEPDVTEAEEVARSHAPKS